QVRRYGNGWIAPHFSTDLDDFSALRLTKELMVGRLIEIARSEWVPLLMLNERVDWAHRNLRDEPSGPERSFHCHDRWTRLMFCASTHRPESRVPPLSVRCYRASC